MKSRAGHVPTRSCTGCNTRDAQSRLLRFALVDGRLIWDGGRLLPGRGAYLHPERTCLDRFVSRKPFLRSLRATVSTVERARLVGERSMS